MTQRLEFHEFGSPETVLRHASCAEAENSGLRLRLLYSPINPADLNYIEGTYGLKPELPAVPGMEGVAEVFESNDVTLPVGSHVMAPPRPGNWCSHRSATAAECVLVPVGVPLVQAAMARVNPPSAWRMLHDFVQLQPGDWVAFNAATSGVGFSLIQIAKQLGLKTVAFARSEASLERLKIAGCTLAFLDHPAGFEEASDQLNSQRPQLALNAVGGESALRLCNLLGEGGTLVTYGAMARKALKVPNSLLIFKDLRLRGFWLNRWFREQAQPQKDPMWAQLFTWMREGKLATPVDSMFALEDFRAALAANAQAGRLGKVLFQFEGVPA